MDVVERPVQGQPPRAACAAREARNVHRRLRQVPRPLGRGEDERGDPVDRNIAVQPADRVGQRRFGEVLLDGQRAVAPVRPRDARAVLAGLCHDGGHRFPSRTVTLEVLGVGQRDHGQRPEEPLRRCPLQGAADLAHRVAVVAAGRVVQCPVHQDVVGGAADHRVDGHADRAAELADAVEARDVPRAGPKAAGQPCRRHDADAVDRLMTARARQQARADESVDLLHGEPRIGDRRPGRVDRHGAEGAVAAPLDRAVRVADNGHPVADPDVVIATNSKAGTAIPAVRSSNATRPGAPSASSASTPSRSRPMSRRSACSASSTSTRTNGRSRRIRAGRTGAPPSRTARRRRPLTGDELVSRDRSNRTPCTPHRVAASNVPHCPHSRHGQDMSAAAAQYGADDSSGTGSGRCVVTG